MNKNLSSTPAPKKDQIKGSKVNPKGSASSEKSASQIKLDAKTIVALSNKLKEFRESHTNKNITLNDLKAVYRRGLGAYSTSHRPNIPRNAWAMARVNKFLEKAAGKKVKAAYVQDDDLLKMHLGGDMSKHLAPNGKPSNLTHEQWHLVRTPEFKAWFGDWENDPQNASKVVDENGEPLVVYHSTPYQFNVFETIYDVGGEEFLIGSHFGTKEQAVDRSKTIGGLYIKQVFLKIKNLKKYDDQETWYANDWERVLKLDNVENNTDGIKKIYDALNLLNIDGFVYLNDYEDAENKSDSYIVFEPNQIKLADGSNTTFDANNPDIRYENGGEVDKFIEDGIVELKMYDTTNDHSKIYGFDAEKPLYIQTIIVSKEHRGKGIGSKVMEYIVDYANKNGHDVIFGNITQKAEPNIDVIKSMIVKSGFNTIEGNDDFYKVMNKDVSETGQDIKCRRCGWQWNTSQSEEFDKYVCHNCGFDNRTFYDTDPIGYKDGGELTNACIEEVVDIINSIQEVKDYYIVNRKLVILFQEELMVFNVEIMNHHLGEHTICHNIIDPEININNKEDYKSIFLNLKNDEATIGEFKEGGEVDYKKKTYAKWKSLVNMSYGEIKRFYDSKEGKEAGLSTKEANEQGISSGRESARWAMKMKNTKASDWTPTMWKWANKQISFISRMSGNKGGLYDDKGNKTRKHTSLLIWGNNPKKESSMKYENGGEMDVRMEDTVQRMDNPNFADISYYDNGGATDMMNMDADTYLPKIMSAYANGGEVDMIFKLNTPTKQPTKLNYIQQVLVRTTDFKKFFGDWEKCAESFLQDNKNNFLTHYKNCSIVIDLITLEPQVVYHGTNFKEEFYAFDVTKKEGSGRPYGYFADNIEYSQNFTFSSQRGQHGIELLYKCFLNIRNPFMAIDEDFYNEMQDEATWSMRIAKKLASNKYGEIITYEQVHEYYKIVMEQIYPYMLDTFQGQNKPFWILMSRDTKKEFKYFLMSHGFDGVRYAEEWQGVYDVDNPAEFTKAWTIFDAVQVKLADGRNINFDPFKDDIRYEEGGSLTQLNQEEMQQENMSKAQMLRNTIGINKFAEGGTVKGDGKNTNDAKKGGFFDGKSHAEGGIKAINKDTGQMLEVEGNEVIINKRSVADDTKREFEGEMMTNREILSKINEMGGGVSFKEGGEINGKSCKCMGKKYKFGGNLISDYDIVEELTTSTTYLNKKPISNSMNYVENLIYKINGNY